MKIWPNLCVVALFITLSGCAPLLNAKNSEQRLEEQVTSFMNAKIERDWGQVYDTFCENYRNSKQRTSFISTSRAKFTSYRIQSITVNPDKKRGTAQVFAAFSSNGFDFPEGLQTQEWVFEQGRWCRDLKPSIPGAMFLN